MLILCLEKLVLTVTFKLVVKLGLMSQFVLLTNSDASLVLFYDAGFTLTTCYFQFYFPGFDDDGSEFHEHIFLDKYLEGFPKQGPIRNFMELVTNGLSKNPYLSVKQKVEHIEWFKKYFNEKRDILKENNIAFA